MEFEPASQLKLIHILSLIGKCLTHVKNSQRKAEKFVVPIIEERYRLPPEERPDDMLSWLMEDAIGEEKDPRNLTLRILSINFGAIHTTAMVSVSRVFGLLLAQLSNSPSHSLFTSYWLSKSCTGNYAMSSWYLSVRNTYSLSGRKLSRSSRNKAGRSLPSLTCAS